jgi:hypothetical protein
MINKYRRKARALAEMGVRPLTPLHVAIPELAALGDSTNRVVHVNFRGRRGGG